MGELPQKTTDNSSVNRTEQLDFSPGSGPDVEITPAGNKLISEFDQQKESSAAQFLPSYENIAEFAQAVSEDVWNFVSAAANQNAQGLINSEAQATKRGERTTSTPPGSDPGGFIPGDPIHNVRKPQHEETGATSGSTTEIARVPPPDGSGKEGGGKVIEHGKELVKDNTITKNPYGEKIDELKETIGELSDGSVKDFLKNTAKMLESGTINPDVLAASALLAMKDMEGLDSETLKQLEQVRDQLSNTFGIKMDLNSKSASFSFETLGGDRVTMAFNSNRSASAAITSAQGLLSSQTMGMKEAAEMLSKSGREFASGMMRGKAINTMPDYKPAEQHKPWPKPLPVN